jgi:hypothetical protein
MSKPDELKDYLKYNDFLKQFIDYQKLIYESDIDTTKWIYNNSLKVGNTK